MRRHTVSVEYLSFSYLERRGTFGCKILILTRNRNKYCSRNFFHHFPGPNSHKNILGIFKRLEVGKHKSTHPQRSQSLTDPNERSRWVQGENRLKFLL